MTRTRTRVRVTMTNYNDRFIANEIAHVFLVWLVKPLFILEASRMMVWWWWWVCCCSFRYLPCLFLFSFLDQLQIYVYCKNKNYHQVQGQIHIKKGNPMILWVSSLQGNGKMKGEE
mmetsp:Transcript_45813/g.51273  ORF Transcript_45813/g.51273 Transcript_45813/m.51273 type:complete len:116 (-) Transcript_45813:21-368(-)